MKRARSFLLIAAGFISAALLTGCISGRKEYRRADFSGENLYNKNAKTGPQLDENDILGLTAQRPTDEKIQEVLDATRDFQLRLGSTILVVQSGSEIPDAAMQQELARYFRIVPHSGIESDIRKGDDQSGLASALRMSAARSSAEAVLVYWGHLEMRRQELGTDLVSWLPILDITVPDEYQKLRLRLKMALVDVRTGKWSTFQAEPFETDALSTRFAREKNEPATLNSLKKKAYHASVEQLVKGYTRP